MFYLFINALILPPGIFVLAGILSALSFRRWPRFSLALLCLSSFALYAISTPFASKHAAAWLEPDHALEQSDLERFKPQAIVVLGANRTIAAPEYGGEDTAGGNLLVRLRYAAKLYHQTRLPILVSAGRGYTDRIAQSDIMAGVLEQELAAPVSWQEDRSLTTWENARFSSAMLRQTGVERILLVTQAFHMKRSMESFTDLGIEVLAAPTGFRSRFDRPLGIRDFYPGAAGFQLSCLVLHELLGLGWYRWQYFSAGG